MRSVFAMESSHCDMDGEMDMPAQLLSVVQSSGYQDSNLQNDGQSKQMNESCCDDNGCSSSCDMSMGASLLIQISSYSPVFVTVESIPAFSSELQLRALTPPSRPPLATS